MSVLKTSAPYQTIVAITPHDTNNVSGGLVRAIWVGAAGAVRILTWDDSDVILPAMQAGIWHPIAVKRVFATNTAAGVVSAGVFGAR